MQELDSPAAVVDSSFLDRVARLAAPMEEAPPASWSDIPVELAGLILGCLPAHIDRVRFAAVCPKWHAATRLVKVPPPMPMLLLPDATVYSLPGSKPFRLRDCTGYTDSCGSWLVFRDEGSCFLKDPFSNATITLPALSRVRLQRVGDDETIDEAGHAWVGMDEGEKLDASKIIFCSPHLIAAIFRFTKADSTRIAVCQPGATSWWSVRVDQYWAPLFLDIVFHQGKLYALDSMDTLFSVDISMDHSTGDPCVSQFQEVISGMIDCQYMLLPRVLILKVPYLVESRGALLVVCRKINLRLKPGQDRIEVVAAERNRFEVFEAKFEQSSWVQVTTLGDDQVLFLRQRCCRSVSISHKEVPRDCIFFLDNEVDDHHWHGSATSSSCSIYSMRDGKVSTALPTVSWKHATVFATWLFPDG